MLIEQPVCLSESSSCHEELSLKNALCLSSIEPPPTLWLDRHESAYCYLDWGQWRPCNSPGCGQDTPSDQEPPLLRLVAWLEPLWFHLGPWCSSAGIQENHRLDEVILLMAICTLLGSKLRARLWAALGKRLISRIAFSSVAHLFAVAEMLPYLTST